MKPLVDTGHGKELELLHRENTAAVNMLQKPEYQLRSLVFFYVFNEGGHLEMNRPPWNHECSPLASTRRT